MTLLVAQAVVVALAVVPITRAGMRHLGSAPGTAIGLAFGMSYAVVALVVGLVFCATTPFRSLVDPVTYRPTARAQAGSRIASDPGSTYVLVRSDEGITLMRRIPQPSKPSRPPAPASAGSWVPETGPRSL